MGVPRHSGDHAAPYQHGRRRHVSFLIRTAQSLDLVYQQGLGAEFIQAVTRFPIDSPNAQLILTGKPSYFRHDHPVTQSPRYLAEGLRSAAAIPVCTRTG